jgi:hypothetical protein
MSALGDVDVTDCHPLGVGPDFSDEGDEVVSHGMWRRPTAAAVSGARTVNP